MDKTLRKKTCIHFSSWVGGKNGTLTSPVYECHSRCMCVSVCMPFCLASARERQYLTSPLVQRVCVLVFVCHSSFASAMEREHPVHPTPPQCLHAILGLQVPRNVNVPPYPTTPLVQRVSVCVLVFVCNSCLTHAKDREHPTPPDPTPPTPPLVCVLVFARHS